MWLTLDFWLWLWDRTPHQAPNWAWSLLKLLSLPLPLSLTLLPQQKQNKTPEIQRGTVHIEWWNWFSIQICMLYTIPSSFKLIWSFKNGPLKSFREIKTLAERHFLILTISYLHLKGGRGIKDNFLLHPSISTSQGNIITLKMRSGMGGWREERKYRLVGRKSRQESQKDKGKADKTEGKEWRMGDRREGALAKNRNPDWRPGKTQRQSWREAWHDKWQTRAKITMRCSGKDEGLRREREAAFSIPPFPILGGAEQSLAEHREKHCACLMPSSFQSKQNCMF